MTEEEFAAFAAYSLALEEACRTLYNLTGAPQNELRLRLLGEGVKLTNQMESRDLKIQQAWINQQLKQASKAA